MKQLKAPSKVPWCSLTRKDSLWVLSKLKKDSLDLINAKIKESKQKEITLSLSDFPCHPHHWQASGDVSPQNALGSQWCTWGPGWYVNHSPHSTSLSSTLLLVPHTLKAGSALGWDMKDKQAVVTEFTNKDYGALCQLVSMASCPLKRDQGIYLTRKTTISTISKFQICSFKGEMRI